MGVLTTLMLAPHMFVVSTFIENAQASIEQTLDFSQRSPLNGQVWPGGDLSPHPTMLLQTWRYNGSHNSGRDPRLAPLTCRMYHVCQFADGSVLFPEAYRGIERIVRACGVQKYIFARQASPDTTFDHSHAMNALVSPIVPPRSTRPVEQLLHFSQIVFGQHISNEQWSSETVDYRRYNGSGDLVDSHGRIHENVAPPLRPLMYSRVDSAFDESEEGPVQKATWEDLVIEKFKKSMDGFEVHRIDEAFPSRAEGSGDASTAEKPQAVCYHSIMSTGEHGDELPARMLSASNPFFLQNKIHRQTRWLKFSETSRNRTISVSANTTRAASAQPRADDGNLNVLFIRDGLLAEDLDSVEKRMQTRLRRIASSSKRELHLSAVRFAATADVELLYLEFQRADVVVAARSAALNNILFMRTASVLIEIFPYSAADDTYGKVASSLGISHLAIMAKANTKSFEKCIDLDKTIPDRSKERLLKAWAKASEGFSAGDRRSHLGLWSPRSQWRLEIPSALPCAARQEKLPLLSADAVLRAIFDRAVVPRL